MPNSGEIQSSASPGFDWNAAGQSAIQSGGNLLGSVVNGLFNMAEAKKQRDWSEQMMDKQNAFSVDMWNKTNAYNSPAMQKQRLIDAGLNPLYYGLDGTSAESFESAQPLGYERAQAPNGLMNLGSDIVNSYRKAELQRAQIDNINADTAQKQNETITETERRQNLIKERDEMDSRIKLNVSQSDLNDKQKEKIDQFMNYADDMYQAQIDRDNNAAALSEAQRDRIRELLPGEKQLQLMTIEDFKHKWSYWSAQINHLANQDAVLAKQAKYYLVSLLSNGVYGSGISAINGYILSLIADDPDLTPAEKDKFEQIFTKSFKPKPTEPNGLYKDAPAGNPYDPNTYQ